MNIVHLIILVIVVITKAEGVWVEDPEGNKYLDMLSSCSALNQGHRHPKIMKLL